MHNMQSTLLAYPEFLNGENESRPIRLLHKGSNLKSMRLPSVITYFQLHEPQMKNPYRCYHQYKRLITAGKVNEHLLLLSRVYKQIH